MLKTKERFVIGLAGVVSAVTAFASCALMPKSSATGCNASPCNTTFQVNVRETLSVTIDADLTSESSGNAGTFLRDSVDLSVATNNAAGFTAAMYSKDSTTLMNASGAGDSSRTIPTLSSSTKRNAVSDRWGYSVNDTSAGADTSDYLPMRTSSSPITILNRGSAGSGSETIYFGTNATTATMSGVYTGTVVINVVTGVIDASTNPITPTNPATPNATPVNGSASAGVASYNATTGGSPTGIGTTTYSYRTTSGNVVTTSTQVSDGDNTSLYAPPQGVSESNRAFASATDSNVVDNGSSLATGLAITSAVTAVAGVSFFVLAKRHEDDDDEEDETV